ncbi:MAG: type II toxin-antitoxin system PemK/MazF family toxin [Pseudomonadota bacterium]
MPIKLPPYTGMILRCDFSGLKPPEMVKIRPVLVISPRPERLSKKTCIVVALSTTTPDPIEKYHLRIELPNKLPDNLSREC